MAAPGGCAAFVPIARRRTPDARYRWKTRRERHGAASDSAGGGGAGGEEIEGRLSGRPDAIHAHIGAQTTPLCRRLVSVLAAHEARRGRPCGWTAAAPVVDALEGLASVLRSQAVGSRSCAAWPLVLLVEPVMHADRTLRASRAAAALLSGLEYDLVLTSVWRETPCRAALRRDGHAALRCLTGAATPGESLQTRGAYVLLRKALRVARETMAAAVRRMNLSGNSGVGETAWRLFWASLSSGQAARPVCLELLGASSLAAVVACALYAAGKLCCAGTSFLAVINALQAARAEATRTAHPDQAWFRDVLRGDILAFYNAHYLPAMRAVIYTSVGRSSALLGGAGLETQCGVPLSPPLDAPVQTHYAGPSVFVRVRKTKGRLDESSGVPRARCVFSAHGCLDVQRTRA